MTRHRCEECGQWVAHPEDPDNLRGRFAALRDIEQVSRGMSPAHRRELARAPMMPEVRTTLPLWGWAMLGAALAVCGIAIVEGIR